MPSRHNCPPGIGRRPKSISDNLLLAILAPLQLTETKRMSSVFLFLSLREEINFYTFKLYFLVPSILCPINVDAKTNKIVHFRLDLGCT